MQPLFAQDPLYRAILLAGYALWAILEVVMVSMQVVRMRSGAKSKDRGSRVIISLTLGQGIFFCLWLPGVVPAATILHAHPLIFWAGIVLIYAGLAFRLYAIIVLGRYFTPTVMVTPNQHVVENGPYRYIRHPSYTGLLIMFLGFGLSSANWLGLLILMGCGIIGLSYRIYIEEQVLLEHLGQPYREYMQRTKWVIPFLI